MKALAIFALPFLALVAGLSDARCVDATPSMRSSQSASKGFEIVDIAKGHPPKRRFLSAKSRTSSKGGSKSSKGGSKSGKGSKSDRGSKSGKKSSKGGKSQNKHLSLKRSCKHNYENDESVELRCAAREERIKDEIDFTLSTGEEGAVVQVKYIFNDKSPRMNRKVEEEYEIYFSNLVEYAPNLTSGDSESYGFGWNENEVVQTINLSEWRPFSRITKDDDGVWQFYVETKDGTARFSFNLSEDGMEGRHLSSSCIKIDVTLADFPWKEKNTFVALLSRVEANTKLKTHYKGSRSKKSKSGKRSKGEATHPTDVEISFDEATLPLGTFMWAKTADVNDSPDGSEVVATSPSDDKIPQGTDESVQYIAFSFLDSDEAEFIYWDPEAGVVYPDEVTDGTAFAATSEGSPVSAHSFPSTFDPHSSGSRFGEGYRLHLTATAALLLLGYAL